MLDTIEKLPLEQKITLRNQLNDQISTAVGDIGQEQTESLKRESEENPVNVQRQRDMYRQKFHEGMTVGQYGELRRANPALFDEINREFDGRRQYK